MRRHVITAALWGVAVFVAYRWGSTLLLGGKTAVPMKAGDMGPISSVLAVVIVFAWAALRAGEAVCDVVNMVTDARDRRAKAREDERKRQARRARERRYANREVRTGHMPVRPDAAANQAA